MSDLKRQDCIHCWHVKEDQDCKAYPKNHKTECCKCGDRK